MTNVKEVIRRLNQEKTKIGRQPRYKLVLPIVLGISVITISAFYLTIFIKSRLNWRAVFLINNHAYFGHLFWNPFSSSVSLTDVYYLQTARAAAGKSGSGKVVDQKMVKLGSELHGPEDRMIIPKNQIIFWEDLKEDSAVVRKIKEINKQ